MMFLMKARKQEKLRQGVARRQAYPTHEPMCGEISWNRVQ